ncbi:SDR family NAD(P)-dependent oxidoreductase [Marinobacter sp. F3R08]|nr:SDR family NAD(P)-dependent oxidoreductase [Marinobacter sp. F3R08]
MELSGKRVLVTGSTTGIGLAIASGLAASGATITIVGRDQAKIDKALATVAESSGHVEAADATGSGR